MSLENAPPGITRWMAADVVFGICSTLAAFVLRKFVLLFLTAASIWFLVLFALYAYWWRTRDQRAAGRRKMYKGIALLTGFLIALAMYYVIVRLDPTLR
jgi:hypothetical protein